jgi:hypothetical protein
MQIRITAAMKSALAQIGHVPDNLRARFDAMAPADGGYALTLSEDDGTALAELVQWHIKTDAATGKPTPETQPFDDLIRLIDAAMFQ